MSEQQKITQESLLIKPKQQKLYPIPDQDWNKLKTMIEECKTSNRQMFRELSMLLFGAFISSLISLIGLVDSATPLKLIVMNWVLVVVSAILGVAFLIVDIQLKNAKNANIELVEKELVHIEEKFETNIRLDSNKKDKNNEVQNLIVSKFSAELSEKIKSNLGENIRHGNIPTEKVRMYKRNFHIPKDKGTDQNKSD